MKSIPSDINTPKFISCVLQAYDIATSTVPGHLLRFVIFRSRSTALVSENTRQFSPSHRVNLWSTYSRRWKSEGWTASQCEYRNMVRNSCWNTITSTAASADDIAPEGVSGTGGKGNLLVRCSYEVQWKAHLLQDKLSPVFLQTRTGRLLYKWGKKGRGPTAGVGKRTRMFRMSLVSARKRRLWSWTIIPPWLR